VIDEIHPVKSKMEHPKSVHSSIKQRVFSNRASLATIRSSRARQVAWSLIAIVHCLSAP